MEPLSVRVCITHVSSNEDVFTLAGYLLTLFKKKKKDFKDKRKMHYGDLGEFFQGPQETSMFMLSAVQLRGVVHMPPSMCLLLYP